MAVQYCRATSLLTVIFQQTIVPPSTTYFTVSWSVCYNFYPKFLHLSARSFLSLHTQGSRGRIFILYVYVFRSYLSANGRSTNKACQVSLPVTPRYQVKWDCWWVTYKILIWSLTRTPCVALGKSQHLSAAIFPWLKCLFVCYAKFFRKNSLFSTLKNIALSFLVQGVQIN